MASKDIHGYQWEILIHFVLYYVPYIITKGGYDNKVLPLSLQHQEVCKCCVHSLSSSSPVYTLPLQQKVDSMQSWTGNLLRAALIHDPGLLVQAVENIFYGAQLQ